MHFPATSVAPVSIVASHVCYPSFQLDISARRLCWGGAAARGGRALAGKDADRAYKRRSIGDEQESDWMLADVFNPIPCNTLV